LNEIVTRNLVVNETKRNPLMCLSAAGQLCKMLIYDEIQHKYTCKLQRRCKTH